MPPDLVDDRVQPCRGEHVPERDIAPEAAVQHDPSPVSIKLIGGEANHSRGSSQHSDSFAVLGHVLPQRRGSQGVRSGGQSERSTRAALSVRPLSWAACAREPLCVSGDSMIKGSAAIWRNKSMMLSLLPCSTAAAHCVPDTRLRAV